MIKLQCETPAAWTEAVMHDFDAFLLDHASAEKKAASMAMTMVSHYPDRSRLVASMIDLALEELAHFRQVNRWIERRGLHLAADEKDPYVNALRRSMRRGRDAFLMDRLLVAGIIEARGAERFGLVAKALPHGELKRFYQSIARSEENHHRLFSDLALAYAPEEAVHNRLETLLKVEADIIGDLPHRAALH